MTLIWLRKGILKARRAVRDEGAATAVEFALVVPFFLIFILGIFDLGRLFFIKNVMQTAVEQSTRFAMVNPSATKAALETYAAGKADPMFAGITFTADVPATDVVSSIYYRTITATYTFSYMMPIVLGDVSLTTMSRVPVNTP